MSESYRSFKPRAPRYHLAASHPVSIYEPAVFSAADRYAISGHGFGFDGDVHNKAVGEYLERHVAFRAIKPASIGRVCEMGLSDTEQEALIRAIEQTCERIELKEKIDGHAFKLVEVHRLGTGERCLYPSVLLSLHGSSEDLDDEFVPVRDTSGNAIHPDRAVARRSAILEFVERQCTTAMWVSRRCNSIFPLDTDLKGHTKASVVGSQMTSCGTLTGYDISYLQGVSVIFAVYRSHSENDVVKFACGCAADFTFQAAALKAFTEVWQTSLLLPQMAFFGAKEYGSNRLKENFQAANRVDFDLGVGVRPLQLAGTLEGQNSEQKLIASLLAVSKNIYVFEKEIMISGVRMWFCRIVSPDFFVHMSPDEGINIENKWIAHFCAPDERRIEPLPFS